MARTKTLFVLGAGASVEVGLPLGAELTRTIASLVDIKFENGHIQTSGDKDIVEALRTLVRLPGNNPGDFNPYISAGREIAKAMPLAMSIDNYLDAHRSNKPLVACGKLGIVTAILQAERTSKLIFPFDQLSPSDFNQASTSWFMQLWRLMAEGISKEAIDAVTENISFVVFNYDRCLEHFLVRAAQHHFTLGRQDAQQLISKIPIVHPYGSISRLPGFGGESNGIDYGERVHGSKLLHASQQIRTFTERIEDPGELRRIRGLVEDAERIVFLGFAFHKPNMELLRPEESPHAKAVFATTKGVSDSDRNVIAAQVREILGDAARASKIEIAPKTCAELFADYWRSLSLM